MTHGQSKAQARGLWIAFFGPDGVGKSAVIERLQGSVGGAFSGGRCFHFRPRFGRRSDRAPVTEPHAQRARGLIISISKLIYWLLDCWFGYLALIGPSLQRSGLVVFDRYLPDLLVDPMRYRLPASANSFAAKLAKLAPQPDLYILLDAPAETVRRRKQEISLPEAQRQRIAYLKLFKSLPNTLVVAADCPVEDIAQHLATAISSFIPNLPASQKAAFVADARLN